jgi:DNA-binding NarL/FixJ family response regulator
MNTVMLVDDHPIVREGMRQLLQARAEFTIVGEADLGMVALEMVERLRPDLAVVDLMLPDLNGMEVIRRMLRASPRTRVAALSMYSDELHVGEALRAGAIAYIVKGASAEIILMALREAVAGRTYLSPPLTDRIIEQYSSPGSAGARPADRYRLLTTREREVLEWLARGASYAEIADKLTISPRTAETHRTNLMRKLDLKTQTDLTRYAIQRGLIAPEQERVETPGAPGGETPSDATLSPRRQ